MEHRTTFFSLLLAATFVLALPARGQQPGQPPMDMPGNMPMMQMPMMQAMHGQMMQNPMHRTSMMAFMLPTLADTLELTGQQRERLTELKRTMMQQRQQMMQRMQDRQQQMRDLFAGEGQPAPAEVRQHLMAVAELRARQQADLYEVAREMQQVLTDEQRQMLTGMTPQQTMRQMMANMTMMDMMQMMRAMHGGMVGGGMMNRMPMMMQPGMMRPGMMQQRSPMNRDGQNR
ncbi:MAG: hypothetical protein ACNS61_00525 [Candidatus Wenzhouxiangella sp. M2_3B_020]